MDVKFRIKKISELDFREIERWKRLCCSSEYLRKAFLSYKFVSTVGKLCNNVYVNVIYRDDDVIGFFPFQYFSLIKKSLGIAERVAGHMNDCFGIISVPDFSISPYELIKASRINVLDFACLDHSQKKIGLFGSIKDVNWNIDLTIGSNDYFKDLKKREKKYFKETMRRKRKLEKDYGPLLLDIYLNLVEGEKELDRLIKYKSRQYLATGKKDIFKIGWKRQLLYELLNSEDESCRGVLACLYAGYKWVGSYYGLKSYSRLHSWFPVYNPELKKYAPGHLLYWSLIEHNERIGIKVIDRGVGDTSAKRILGNKKYYYYRDVWSRWNLRGLCYRAFLSLKWRFLG